ncbi:hypothetical protein [Candidatus Uabimicrobium sp. HlEnr_7]|uniref:hypothetical protein n=1 Tax=Candidatus Uabimicrobium helgolandensis TaxID=3095367 RepID=UPI00355783C6
MKIFFYTFFFICLSNVFLLGNEQNIPKRQALKTTESIVKFLWKHGDNACSVASNLREKNWVNLNWTRASYQYIKSTSNEVIAIVPSIFIFLFELILNIAILFLVLAIFCYGAIVYFVTIIFTIFVAIWDLTFGT